MTAERTPLGAAPRMRPAPPVGRRELLAQGLACGILVLGSRVGAQSSIQELPGNSVSWTHINQIIAALRLLGDPLAADDSQQILRLAAQPKADSAAVLDAILDDDVVDVHA